MPLISCQVRDCGSARLRWRPAFKSVTAQKPAALHRRSNPSAPALNSMMRHGFRICAIMAGKRRRQSGERWSRRQRLCDGPSRSGLPKSTAVYRSTHRPA